MTRSNRILNRLGLLLLALAAAAVAVLLLRPELPVELPTLGVDRIPSPWLQGGLIALAVLAVVIALSWTLSRGRGADGTALDHDGISVDAHLVEGLLRRELAGEPEVLHLRLRAFRPQRVLLAEVQVRRGADLAHVHERLRAAVASADELLGEAPPIVAHITTGLRTRLAGTTRTH